MLMAVISVPKTPRKAYNPRRPAGTLLQNQLRHLEWAVRPAGKRLPKDFEKIKPARTEAEAAARIETLTLELQRQSASPPAAIPAAPPPATRPVRKKTAKAKPTAKAKTKARPRSHRPSRRRTGR
jgi:hypothetical protein